MLIKGWTLEEFARHAKKYWPKDCKAHPLPTEGCMPAVRDWLEATGIGILGFMAKLKTADGNRAWALYQCAYRSWLPGNQAVELIKTAPGDRAMALWNQAVELIKTAPGDRAWALRLCADRGWITKAEAYLDT